MDSHVNESYVNELSNDVHDIVMWQPTTGPGKSPVPSFFVKTDLDILDAIPKNNLIYVLIKDTGTELDNRKFLADIDTTGTSTCCGTSGTIQTLNNSLDLNGNNSYNMITLKGVQFTTLPPHNGTMQITNGEKVNLSSPLKDDIHNNSLSIADNVKLSIKSIEIVIIFIAILFFASLYPTL